MGTKWLFAILDFPHRIDFTSPLERNAICGNILSTNGLLNGYPARGGATVNRDDSSQTNLGYRDDRNQPIVESFCTAPTCLDFDDAVVARQYGGGVSTSAIYM